MGRALRARFGPQRCVVFVLIFEITVHPSAQIQHASSAPSFCHCTSSCFSAAFAIADLLSSRSYTNYARLVMFSFGFQKAFERGFQADDEVFFTRVRRFYTRACPDSVNTFPRAWKAPRLLLPFSWSPWSRLGTSVSLQMVREFPIDSPFSVF